MTAFINSADLTPPSPATKLHRVVGRTVSAQYRVEDDIVRDVEGPRGLRFRPTHAAVNIDLDTGAYQVDLVGPIYTTHGGLARPSARKRVTGEHYEDVRDARIQLVADVIHACLTDHGLVKQ